MRTVTYDPFGRPRLELGHWFGGFGNGAFGWGRGSWRNRRGGSWWASS